MTRRMFAILLAAALLLSMGGCRRRVIVDPEYIPPSAEQTPTAPPTPTPTPSETPTPTPTPSPSVEPTPEPSVEPSTAPSAELSPVVIAAPSVEPLPEPSDEPSTEPIAAPSDAPAVTETPSVDGGETKPNDEGGAIATVVDEITEYLDAGLGSMYECQKGYVYLETTDDFTTINRSDARHRLILDAGGYNCGDKLLADKLTVDAGWVLRKNPAVMVKCVGSEVLGAGVSDSAAAAAEYAEFVAREGLDGASAVINGRVLLLSDELFATDEGRLLAKLFIARELYPTLFGESDIDEFMAEIRDGGGVDFTDGLFTYRAVRIGG